MGDGSHRSVARHGPDGSRGQSVKLVRHGSPLPLHAQLRDLLLEMIERGEVQPGVPLPPERELAARHGVSLAPVRQAILGLARDGLLYRVRGQGTFLRDRHVVERVSILSPFTESMREQGFQVDIEILRQERVPAWPDAVEGLHTTAKSLAVFERRAIVDGEPLAILLSALVPTAFPGLLRKGLDGGSLYRSLDRAFGVIPARAETTIEMRPCSARESELLEVSAGSPLLVARGTTFDRANVPVEFFNVFYRPDRVRLRFDSYRSGGQSPRKQGTRSP